MTTRRLTVPAFSLVVALLLFTGCAGQNIRPAGSGTAAMAMNYDIPRVDGIAIDGSSDDWADRGFRIDTLCDEEQPNPGRPPSPKVRLGWDDRGLLALVHVTDNTPVEAESNFNMADKDSVEFYVADPADPTQNYHVTITPGRDGKHPVRCLIEDQRDRTVAPASLKIEYAVHADPDGYTVEARLPWANLWPADHPAAGKTVLLQVLANDATPTVTRIRYGWCPTVHSWNDGTQTYALRLAEVPAPPFRAAAFGRVVLPRQLQLWINDADARAANQPADYQFIRAATGQPIEPLSTQRLPDDPHRSLAILACPKPGDPGGPISIRRDGRQIAVIDIPTTSPHDVVHNADFRFDSFVFSGEQFPSGRFVDPVLIHDCLGPYTIQTDFYDADFNPVTNAEKPGRYGAVVQIKNATGVVDIRQITLYRMPGQVQHWQDNVPKLNGITLPSGYGIDPAVQSAQAQLIGDEIGTLLRDDTRRDAGVAILLAGLEQIPPDSTPLPDRLGPNGIDENWWYALGKKIGLEKPYEFVQRLPDDYDKDPSKKWPLILFLHGSGQNVDMQTLNLDGIVIETRGRRDFPFILIAPRCDGDHHWRAEKLNDFLDWAMTHYRVDPDRVYLAGISMGGYGTYAMACAHPERFAAAVPICGAGDVRDIARMKDLPTWSFHGDQDPAVSFATDKACVDALRQLGGRVRFTIYPGVGHDSWDPTYSNSAMYDWLLQQKRGQPAEPAASPAAH